MNYNKFCLQAPSVGVCPKHCADDEKKREKERLEVAETRREWKGMGNHS